MGPKGGPKKGPKKGAQRKGTIFIDGPSMDSLMVSINEFIDGYPSMNSLMDVHFFETASRGTTTPEYSISKVKQLMGPRHDNGHRWAYLGRTC